MTPDDDRPPPSRTVIQIATGAVEPADNFGVAHTLYALCDDGRLYQRDGPYEAWRMVQPVPQPVTTPVEYDPEDDT